MRAPEIRRFPWITPSARSKQRTAELPNRMFFSFHGVVRGKNGVVERKNGVVKSIYGPVFSVYGPVESFYGPVKSFYHAVRAFCGALSEAE